MTRSSLAEFAVVVALACAVAAAVGAFLEVADVLPDDVGRVLRYARDRPATVRPELAGSSGGMEIDTAHGPPTGADRAVQVMLFGVVAGAVPTAIVGGLLASYARRHRLSWPARWWQPFLAGWIFQLTGLVLNALLLMLFLVGFAVTTTTDDFGDVSSKDAFVALILAVNCATAVWGLRSWRELQQSVGAGGLPVSVLGVSR